MPEDETIDNWLHYAENRANESRSYAKDTYQAGYDQGYLDALRAVKQKLTELWGLETK